jgi:predicted MFS family arabinose efflux permease
VLAGLAGLVVVQALLLLPISMGLAIVWAIGGGVTWLVVVGQQHRMVSLAPQSAQVVLGLNGSALYLGISLGSVAGGVALGTGGAAAVVATAVGLAALAAVFTAATFRRPAPALPPLAATT